MASPTWICALAAVRTLALEAAFSDSSAAGGNDRADEVRRPRWLARLDTASRKVAWATHAGPSHVDAIVRRAPPGNRLARRGTRGRRGPARVGRGLSRRAGARRAKSIPIVPVRCRTARTAQTPAVCGFARVAFGLAGCGSGSAS
jgi:hypothetical protein